MGQEQIDFTRRVNLLAILLVSGGFAWVASGILLKIGVSEIWIRYGLSFLVLYFSLNALVWRWLNTGAQNFLPQKNKTVDSKENNPKEESSQGSANFLADVLGDAYLLVAILIFVAGLALCVIFTPLLILDLVVVELLVILAGLRVKNWDAQISYGEILRKTYPLGIAFLVLSVTWGLLFSLMFPRVQSVVQLLWGHFGL